MYLQFCVAKTVAQCKTMKQFNQFRNLSQGDNVKRCRTLERHRGQKVAQIYTNLDKKPIFFRPLFVYSLRFFFRHLRFVQMKLFHPILHDILARKKSSKHTCVLTYMQIYSNGIFCRFTVFV